MTYSQDIHGAKRSIFWGVGSRIRVDKVLSDINQWVMHAAIISSFSKSCSEPEEKLFLQQLTLQSFES